MKMPIHVIGLLLLFSTQVHGYSEIYGSTARQIAQRALIYANDYHDRLPETLDDIPDIDSIINPNISRRDISYLAPSGATMALPSDTPIVWVRMRERNMIAVGFIGGNVRYFEPSQGPRPKGFFESLNLVLVASGGLNVLLFALVLFCSLGRRNRRLTNRSTQ